MEKDTTRLTSSLGRLEREFLIISGGLTYDGALANGYLPVSNVSFVNSHVGRTVTYLSGETRE